MSVESEAARARVGISRAKRTHATSWLIARGGHILAPTVILVGFFVLWEVLVRRLHTPKYILPPPSAVLRTLWIDRHYLLSEMIVTCKEIAIGFGIAFGAAMTLGVLLSHSMLLRRGIYPLLVASQTIPIIAIAPILLIWFGYGIMPKVIVTALISFFPLTVNTITGFGAVDAESRTLFHAYRASRRQTFVSLTLPSALPYIFAGIKISVTFAVIGATIGEWVGADAGLGYVILNAGQLVLTARMFAALTLLSVIGVVLFSLAVALEWWVMPWRRGGAN